MIWYWDLKLGKRGNSVLAYNLNDSESAILLAEIEVVGIQTNILRILILTSLICEKGLSEHFKLCLTSLA